MPNMTDSSGRKGSTSREHVLAALRAHVRAAAPGAPLPSDARLAQRWGVSPRTIARVMKTLSSQRLVVRVRGKGTFVAPVEDTDHPVGVRRNAAADLADSLRRDIFLGHLVEGEPLPAIKFIRRQFGVAAATVSGAYRVLADEGLVSRIGRAYFVGRLADMVNRRNAGDIIVYLCSDSARERVLESRSYGTAFHRMEDLLARNGYTVH
ncbi:MAG: GntR family transcriptional regulator, partial [Chitinivibrionales bacterium]|nr:GntR family transcriptional regulator [Chitinivibrionales bacterium]